MRPATASIPVFRATGGVRVVVPEVTVEGGNASTVIANARNILAITVKVLPPFTVTTGTTTLTPPVALDTGMEAVAGLMIVLYCTLAGLPA